MDELGTGAKGKEQRGERGGYDRHPTHTCTPDDDGDGGDDDDNRPGDHGTTEPRHALNDIVRRTRAAAVVDKSSVAERTEMVWPLMTVELLAGMGRLPVVARVVAVTGEGIEVMLEGKMVESVGEKVAATVELSSAASDEADASEDQYDVSDEGTTRPVEAVPVRVRDPDTRERVLLDDEAERSSDLSRASRSDSPTPRPTASATAMMKRARMRRVRGRRYQGRRRLPLCAVVPECVPECPPDESAPYSLPAPPTPAPYCPMPYASPGEPGAPPPLPTGPRPAPPSAPSAAAAGTAEATPAPSPRPECECTAARPAPYFSSSPVAVPPARSLE